MWWKIEIRKIPTESTSFYLIDDDVSTFGWLGGREAKESRLLSLKSSTGGIPHITGLWLYYKRPLTVFLLLIKNEDLHFIVHPMNESKGVSEVWSCTLGQRLGIIDEVPIILLTFVIPKSHLFILVHWSNLNRLASIKFLNSGPKITRILFNCNSSLSPLFLPACTLMAFPSKGSSLQ